MKTHYSFIKIYTAITLVGIAFLCLPICVAFFKIFQSSNNCILDERMICLLKNTATQSLVAVFVALSSGIILGPLCVATNMRGAKTYTAILFLGLLVPMPLVAGAWETLAGINGILTPLWSAENQPYPLGYNSAVCAGVISGIAYIPLASLILGYATRSIDSALLDDATLNANNFQKLYFVIRPLLTPIIVGVAFIVGLLTASDISVTDLLVVRTFAEEVYIQFEIGDARTAYATALPHLLVCSILAFFYYLYSKAHPVSITFTSYTNTERRSLGKSTFILTLLCGCIIFISPISIILSLIYMLDSTSQIIRDLEHARFALGSTIRWTLCAGVITAIMSLFIIPFARKNNFVRIAIITWAFLSLALSAPLLSITIVSLKATAISIFPVYTNSIALSSFWVIYGYVLRWLPIALLATSTYLPSIALDTLESAECDGASKWQSALYVAIPQLIKSSVFCAILVAILSASDVSTTLLLMPPGTDTIITSVFAALHYRSDATVATLALASLIYCGTIAITFSTLLRR